MSVTRGTTTCSPCASARRSALEMTSSSVVIGSRWLTPDRLSILRSDARLEGDLLDHLADVVGNLDLERAGPIGPGLLLRDRHRVAARDGIVRADLRPDAVLQRRDDLAARRVVLRIRGEDEHDVELQPDRIALNLDVAFLQDVEQADLDLAGEIGQLVDREDAAVRARQQPVVHRQLVGQVQPRLAPP